MALFAVNQRLAPQWSLEQALRAWAQADVPALGLLRSKLSGQEPEQLRSLLDQYQRRVASVHHLGGFTGSDGRRFRQCVDDALQGLQLAAAVGAPCAVVYSGARGGHTYNHAKRLVRDALEELAPHADQLQVDLAIETVHPQAPQDLTFLVSLDDAMEILDRVQHPRVKLVLDLYHLGAEVDLPQRAAELVSQVALVQLADAKTPPQGQEDRCLPGQGVLPVEEVVAALKAAGYDGPWEIEVHGPTVAALDPVQVLQQAKAAYQWLVLQGPKPF